MAWWGQFLIVWLSIDVVIVATGWYGVTTIKQISPCWWERAIACEVDSHFDKPW